MGTILSVNNSTSRSSVEPIAAAAAAADASKRLKLATPVLSDHDNSRLIPGLPDEISFQILARVPRINYLSLKLVSRGWKAALTCKELFQARNDVKKTEEWIYLFLKLDDATLSWYGLDLVSRKFQRLPPMPTDDQGWSFSLHDAVRIVDVVRGWLGGRYKFNQTSLSGCSFGVSGGCLYVLGGLSKGSTSNNVWRYDPIPNSWSEVSKMSTGRACFKTGVLDDKLYVVGGVTRRNGVLTPLLSAEVFDPLTGLWSGLPSMPFSKAQAMPTALLADLLIPIATGIESYQGKLFVPQSWYSWPFFVDIGGEVYNPISNSWDEMPLGMGEGWPAKQAGTKMSAIVDGKLYGLDPSSSLDTAQIKVYDHKHDTWEVVMRDIPMHNLGETEIPYFLVVLLGKLHIITKDAGHNIMIMLADIHNPSGSASYFYDSSQVGSPSTSESRIWNILATKAGNSGQLIGCQVLDV